MDAGCVAGIRRYNADRPRFAAKESHLQRRNLILSIPEAPEACRGSGMRVAHV